MAEAADRFPHAHLLTIAVFAVYDDGTLTRRITSVNEVPQDNKPAVFRHLDEAERRINLADGISAVGFLAGVIMAEGWMVTQ